MTNKVKKTDFRAMYPFLFRFLIKKELDTLNSRRKHSFTKACDQMKLLLLVSLILY